LLPDVCHRLPDIVGQLQLPQNLFRLFILTEKETKTLFFLNFAKLIKMVVPYTFRHRYTYLDLSFLVTVCSTLKLGF
jgi:hypothetical protein